MNAKKITVSLLFSALVLVFMLWIIDDIGPNPENTQLSKAVFFVS